MLVAVALTIPFLLVGVSDDAAAATTDRYLAIEESSANPDHAWATFDGNPPKVFDFNGDGQLEIIAQNDNHWAYVFDSQDGDVLAERKATVPSGWGARTFNGPEAAVLTPGGDPHLILASSAAYISAFRYVDSQSHGDYFHFEKEWQIRLNQCHGDPGMDAKVVLADLDQDGSLEIIAATEELGVYALRHDGSMLWHNCVGGGNAAPGIGDLNQDGYPDVVHVNDGGTVAALNGLTGGWLWGFEVDDAYNVGSGAITVQPAVAQLNGQGGPDIVLGIRDSHDPNNWDDNHAMLLALDHKGRVLWNAQHSQANPLTYTRPVVVDADNDGSPEVYWADWNTVGHKPPHPDDPDAWKRTGPANFYRYSQWGTLEWRTTLDTWWSNKDLAIGDVDGDGVQEVLANGPSNDGSQDGIWYLDVNTGAKETFTSVYPWKVQRAPILADLWGSGTMQWVVEVDPATSGHQEGILIYDTHASYDAAWPHVAYPRTPSGGDGGGGDFTASFSGVQGNEWWIQTQVSTSGGSLSQVDVSLNGGSWKPLENKGWGWAASYHAPEGTIVQLRATSTGGATDTSGCYRWTDATGTQCGGGGGGDGGGGDFDARFHGVQGNEWWIQTQVDTQGGQLGKVDVRLDGGSWKPLKDEGWGWAASYHAPQGTIVQFRATSTTGATDLSACLRWTDVTRVDCGSSSFTAEFSNVRGNEWWVEAEVDVDGGTLAGVDARVNGGSWQSLQKQDWGSWAKSMHAPSGSTVEFRAISSSGDTAHSGSYTW